MSRVLVLGASGMLGHKVCQRLRDHEVVGLVRGPAAAYRRYAAVFDGVTLEGGIDVLAGDRLEETIGKHRPRFVVNCVGLVEQLDEAADPDLALAINARLPHRLARLCERLEARLIHVSTDRVFDGRRGPYRESDPPDATDLYGRSKALGETGPEQAAALTLRTSFIGRELRARPHGLVEWFLAQAGSTVEGYAGVIYSGLTSGELADLIRRLIEDEPDLCGVYQVAAPPISKHDLLALIRESFGLEVVIRRVEEPISDRSLVGDRLAAATRYAAPSWSEMVRRMRDDPTPYDSWRSREGGAP